MPRRRPRYTRATRKPNTQGPAAGLTDIMHFDRALDAAAAARISSRPAPASHALEIWSPARTRAARANANGRAHVGQTSENKARTGMPSKAPKSTGCSRKHRRSPGRHTCSTIGLRGWGIAIPSPIPVDCSASRARRTCRRNSRSTSSGRRITSTIERSTPPYRRRRPGSESLPPAAPDRARGPRRRALGLGEQLRGNLGLVGARPLEQFGPVEAELLVHPVRRELALSDPPVHGLFRNRQQLRHFANCQLHP